jgi:hypothetical protein
VHVERTSGTYLASTSKLTLATQKINRNLAKSRPYFAVYTEVGVEHVLAKLRNAVVSLHVSKCSELFI